MCIYNLIVFLCFLLFVVGLLTGFVEGVISVINPLCIIGSMLLM